VKSFKQKNKIILCIFEKYLPDLVVEKWTCKEARTYIGSRTDDW
jgi:hypothetical protein